MLFHLSVFVIPEPAICVRNCRICNLKDFRFFCLEIHWIREPFDLHRWHKWIRSKWHSRCQLSSYQIHPTSSDCTVAAFPFSTQISSLGCARKEKLLRLSSAFHCFDVRDSHSTCVKVAEQCSRWTQRRYRPYIFLKTHPTRICVFSERVSDDGKILGRDWESITPQ